MTASHPDRPSLTYLSGLDSAGSHRMAVWEWAPSSATASTPIPIICVHGLTRNGRDFDRLAERLSATRPVYCPDIVGRGRSDDLRNPTDYSYATYMADVTALIARIGVTQVDWVGTSMGGLLGMMMAAGHNTPIRRLVINDVGPTIGLNGLKRIAAYVGMNTDFPDTAAVERHMRANYAPFGITRDDDWRHLAQHGTRTTANGRFTLAHDPRIAEAFKTLTTDVNLWPLYDQINIPTLVLRGGLSDIFDAATAESMTQRGPRAICRTFPNIGHAPALMEDDQINAVAAFLGA